ncbi:MAG TPA: PP2C family serine/threonine-protein phosphatase [Jiangellaceae bacterium]|nr:PP2C family serine/threonine-protein phosphatase [Jiangellaceae bacterium]
MPLTLRYAARSDVGLVREGNEDSGYAGPRLLAVADGMGGHAAGEVASSAAIEELVHVERVDPEVDPLGALKAAVNAANARIRQMVEEVPARQGMGTTLTALFWSGQTLALAHIGDSRGYLLRDGELNQITHDHTFVQTLVDEGRITADEASVHPARSMILRTLQGDSDPELDLELVEVRGGDRILVCSDGLSGIVRDETMRNTLVENADLATAADALVGLALKAGAPDNVTCVVADVVETADPPSVDDTAEAFLVGAATHGVGETTPLPSARTRRGPGAAMRSLLGSAQNRRAENEDVDVEALRYAPQPPRRYRWLRRIGIAAIVLLIAWAGLYIADDYVRAQYYVGEQAGTVAIFRGVSQEVGPLRLSDVHEVAAGLPVAALPEIVRDRVVATIPASDLPDAEQIIDNLRDEACRAHEPTPTPTSTNPPAVTLRPTTGATSSSTALPAPSRVPGAATPGREAPLPRTTGPTVTVTPRPQPTTAPGFPGLDCADSL